MSSDDPEMLCDWCVSYPHSLPETITEASPAAPASVAVAVADCCNNDRLDFLLCERHWMMLRDQPLPGTCSQCGAVAESLDDIVSTVMPLGEADADILTRRDTVTVPAAGQGAVTADLPNAIRHGGAHLADPDMSYRPAGAPAEPSAPGDGVDYPSAVETVWVEMRQESADAAYNTASVEINDLHTRYSEAHQSGDGVLTAQLGHTIATLTFQRDQAARAASDALKRDRQAFSLWRQTPDGQQFLAWLQRTFAMTSWVSDMDEQWDAAWGAALASIPPHERVAHARTQWIDRPRRHHIVRWARDIAVVVALIGVVLALAVSPVWWALAVAGGVAAGYAAYTGRDTAWTAANALAGRQAHDHRVARFGFDPLDEPNRPAPPWSTTDATAYAASLSDIAFAGFETAPAPGSLPEPVWPRTVPVNSVRIEELRAVLLAHGIT